MNSLNLISSRVIGLPQGTRPRSRSQGEQLKTGYRDEPPRGRSYTDENIPTLKQEFTDLIGSGLGAEADTDVKDEDEKQPLLQEQKKEETPSTWRRVITQLADAITAILAAIGAPVVWVAQSFRDHDGHFHMLPRRLKRERISHAVPKSNSSASQEKQSEKPTNRIIQDTKLRHSSSSDTLSSSTSESDNDQRKPKVKRESPRSDSETRRSSIRIKEQTDPTLKKRKANKASALSDAPMTVDSIKSPTSASTGHRLSLTRYPHAPQPPRPLTPRRQPSYSNLIPRSPTRIPPLQQKTLILDLDETLIHSLAKGGRMSTGHMVEVKLSVPVALPPSPSPSQHQSPTVLAPQHPILYYVHKRPHCDDFLRKVSKWYKLVIFTASVQEYADPVVDWLEQERKYFSARYYRQHCTFRNGAYVKDLSSVEPDLSRAVILDNSPVSYIFHEDNAIPIEGWINDPTDNDLLHLIPMLEALQYVTDVRALLALRRGEAEAA